MKSWNVLYFHKTLVFSINIVKYQVIKNSLFFSLAQPYILNKHKRNNNEWNRIGESPTYHSDVSRNSSIEERDNIVSQVITDWRQTGVMGSRDEEEVSGFMYYHIYGWGVILG